MQRAQRDRERKGEEMQPTAAVIQSFQVDSRCFTLPRYLPRDLYRLTFSMPPSASRWRLSFAFSLIRESRGNERASGHRFAALKYIHARVPLCKLARIVIVPLVRRSGSLREFPLHLLAICPDPFTVISRLRGDLLAARPNPLPRLNRTSGIEHGLYPRIV